MTDLNKVIISGNVVHDIGERDSQKVGETTKLTITIATNKSVKTNGEWKNKASFFDVVLWGKLADNLRPYLVKGKGVAVVGTLDQDRWEKDGQKKSKDYITADQIKLLGGKADDESHAQQNTNNELGFPEDIPTSKGEPVF
jgi:single-strand DNA-binding protein